MATGEGSDGEQPKLSLTQLATLCSGLLGVQVVWALQNVNTTRILQSLGADVAALPVLWIAGPITGLLVPPVIGYWSDRTRSRWGRRKPFILAGALLTAMALVGMATAPSLAAAVVMLWLLTASLNAVMQPLRALTADRLSADQRASGFAMQACFISIGAVLASSLPWVLTNVGGVDGSGVGEAPASVRIAFGIGAVVLLLTVGWGLARAPDDPAPDVMAIGPATAETEAQLRPTIGAGASVAWLLAGPALASLALLLQLRREIYLLAVLASAYGLTRLFALRSARPSSPPVGPIAIIFAIATLPPALRRLGVVQFFTWFALFAMWVSTTPAVAFRHFGTTDPASASYGAAADWVGVLFSLYDGVAVAAALALPRFGRRFGLRGSHALCLVLGSMGVLGVLMEGRHSLAWIPALGLGCAWASILTTPYVIVANVAPPARVGLYLGIHNLFLVLPQLVAAATLGTVVERLLGGRPDAMLWLAAASLAVAALCALFLPKGAESERH